LGALAGQFLGGILGGNRNNGNQGGTTRKPDVINNIINGVVGTALNNTDVQIGFKDGNFQVAVLPTDQNNNNNNNNIPPIPPPVQVEISVPCKTVSGANPGKNCVLPFIYKGVRQESCTLEDADDGKAWCSTLVDTEGVHVGGKGQWGHCSADCFKQKVPEPSNDNLEIQGNIRNSGLDKVPWFPKDGKLGFLAGLIHKKESTTSNRLLAFGLNQPNVAGGTCNPPGGGFGKCRHLHHCLKPEYFDVFTFIRHICFIEGRYIGVCCSENIDIVTQPPTTRPTQPPTTRPTQPPTTRPTQAPTQPTTVKPTSSAPLQSCGRNKKFQTRIVGGRPADPDEWPWLAALIRKGGQGSGQYCGATLISDIDVVTAAHCLAPFQKEQIQVKLGEYNFNEAGETGDQIFEVREMKLHERYDPVTFENDIAMIKLDRPIIRSKSVSPICLPGPTEEFTNSRAFVIGWGTIYFGGPTSDILQEVNVRVWDTKDCAANYKKLGRDVLDTMMCAGDDFKDSCQGDSGGPLNCKDRRGFWRLCGIVSWGAKCAEKEFPGVYTKTTKYLDWIRNNS